MLFHFIVSFSYNVEYTFKYLCITISNFYYHVTIVANLIDHMVMNKGFCIAIRNFSACAVNIQRIFNSDCNATNTRWKPTPEPNVHVTGRKKCVNLSQNKDHSFTISFDNFSIYTQFTLLPM